MNKLLANLTRNQDRMLPAEYPPGPFGNHFTDSQTLTKAGAIEVHSRLFFFFSPAVPVYLYSDRQFDLSLGFYDTPVWNKSGKTFERKLESAIAFIGRVTGTDLLIKIAKVGQEGRGFQQPGLGKPSS